MTEPLRAPVVTSLELAPVEEVSAPSFDGLHRVAAKGIRALLGRQAAIQVANLLLGVALARILVPAEFGLFAIATFFVQSVSLLGTFGLAPSLVQRREELTEHALQVGFTVQQVLTTVIVGVIFVVSPAVAGWFPHSPAATVWLVRALAVSLYLGSWRAMSVLQLERRLRFGVLAWIEVVETIAYQGTALGMAISGYGVWSFVWATLARGILGTVLTYGAAPWPVRLRFDRTLAWQLLRFGVPFQVQSFANQAGSWVTPMVAGSLLGPASVGLLTWASSTGRKPLVLVDNVMRVAFPHMSRLQDDADEVERVLLRYLKLMLAGGAFWMVGLIGGGESLVRFIYGPRWVAAVPAMMLYGGVLFADIFSWMLGVTMNGLGNVRITSRVLILREVLFASIAVLLLFRIGLLAVPIASLAAGAMSSTLFFGHFTPRFRLRVSAAVGKLLTISGLSVGLALLVRVLGNEAIPAYGALVPPFVGCVGFGAIWVWWERPWATGPSGPR